MQLKGGNVNEIINWAEWVEKQICCLKEMIQEIINNSAPTVDFTNEYFDI